MPVKRETVDGVLDELCAKVCKVNSEHPLYNSTHEGYGYLMEEVEEMFDEIKANLTNRSINEAFDVAVVAVRYIISMRAKDALQRVGADSHR
jgi:hypothetical protein